MSTKALYTVFSRAGGTSSRTDHMTGHKTSLIKFKIKIISSVFSNHNDSRLEVNYKKKKWQKIQTQWS